MRSIADDARAETAAQLARLPVDERLRLALEMGEQDLRLFQQVHGLDRQSAAREIERRRQIGRLHSGCIEDLLA